MEGSCLRCWVSCLRSSGLGGKGGGDGGGDGGGGVIASCLRCWVFCLSSSGLGGKSGGGEDERLRTSGTSPGQ